MKFQCEYICTQPYGLGPVAAAHIVSIVLHSDSDVRIEANGHCANAVSISALLALSVRNGEAVKVTVDGGDGWGVMKNIENVFTHRTQKKAVSTSRQGASQLVSA